MNEAVLKALVEVVRAPLRFFCRAQSLFYPNGGEIETEWLILCFGENQFFVISDDLESIKGEVYYAHIECIIEQPGTKSNLI